MARLLVFVLCASMVTTQRNGNVVKERGEFHLMASWHLRAVENVRVGVVWPSAFFFLTDEFLRNFR